MSSDLKRNEPGEAINLTRLTLPNRSGYFPILATRRIPYFAEIPTTIRERARWVLWRYVDGRKVPFWKSGASLTRGPIFSKAATNKRFTWQTFSAVESLFQDHEQFDGIGFVLGDGIAGFDLDNCHGREGLAPWAASIVSRLDTYSELSPSFRGVKGLLRATKPEGPCKYVRDDGGSIELYGDGRFFTITGRAFPVSPRRTIEHRQAELDALHGELFPEVCQRPASPALTLHAPDKAAEGRDWQIKERIIAYIAKVPGAVQGCKGSTATFVLAKNLWKKFGPEGMDRALAIEMMLAYYNPKCEPEWSIRDIERKVDQGLKAAGGV